MKITRPGTRAWMALKGEAVGDNGERHCSTAFLQKLICVQTETQIQDGEDH